MSFRSEKSNAAIFEKDVSKEMSQMHAFSASLGDVVELDDVS